MEGTTAGRGRRAIWGTLSFVLVLGIGLSMVAVRFARSRAVEDAGRQATITAQTTLAPLLYPKDLDDPITGARFLELSAAVERDITGDGPVGRVTIWSSTGRNLFDEEPERVGTRSSALSDTIFEVAGGEGRTDVSGDTIRTLVPLWLEPGGTVVVVELDQPLALVTARANGSRNLVAIGLAVALFLTLVMFALSFRRKAEKRETPHEAEEPLLAPRREPRKAPVADAEVPIYARPGFAELERARRIADERAAAAEERALALQARLEALERIAGGAVERSGEPAGRPTREPEEAMPEPDSILARLRLHRLGEASLDLEGPLLGDGRASPWGMDEGAPDDQGVLPSARTGGRS